MTRMSRADSRIVDENTITAYHDHLSHPPHWILDGNCVIEDNGSIDPIEDAHKIANTMCPTCPVIDKCRSYASEMGIDSGVYGGVVLIPGKPN